MSPGAKLPFQSSRTTQEVGQGVCSTRSNLLEAGLACWLTLILWPPVDRIVKGLAGLVPGGTKVPQFTESVPARAARLVTRVKLGHQRSSNCSTCKRGTACLARVAWRRERLDC